MGVAGGTGPLYRARECGVALVVAIGLALAAVMPTTAEAKPLKPVPAAGVGTKAALESPQCGTDGFLAVPYPTRAPCTRPFRQGANNGGATSMGVTRDKIKVVLFLGTHEQQDVARNQPGGTAPVNLATNQPAYVEDSFDDWKAVLDHSYNLWGREFEFHVVTPTGTDEAAQRADALRVAELQPFATIVNAPAAAGGGQVFAAELVAKKIIVFFGGITANEARRQAPYRYLGGFDNNATAVNTAAFAARQLQGETAKWSGDFVDKTRVFGVVRPERSIDWEYFESTAKKEKLKIAEQVVYSVPLDASQTAARNQEEAPILVAKLKDAGVTTVLLFTSFGMNQQLLQAADRADYFPEWVFSGMGAQDIEITARILNGLAPNQMKHVFGLGNLPLFVEGINDPQRVWFDWYWGGNQGVYAAGTVGWLNLLYSGVHMAGPKLTPQTFRRGLFSIPLRGGAASGQVQSFMNGYGPTPGLPYEVYSQVGLDYAIMWWNPNEAGKGKIIFDEGVGKFMYIDGAKRYAYGVKGADWKKGEPELFDPSISISKFDELPEADRVTMYPCQGCPSEQA